MGPHLPSDQPGPKVTAQASRHRDFRQISPNFRLRRDALVEITNRSLDTVSDTARRDRYRVHVHVDVDNAMLDGLGYRLPAWLRDLICCDSLVSTARHQLTEMQ